MESWMIVVVMSAVALLALSWIVYDRRRSKQLQERFGPAYDQTVSEIGNRREAEAQLRYRETHARKLRARPMADSDRERFVAQWKQCQALFVDDPAGAVDEAHELLVRVMRTRGFAADNLNGRSADIAAAYPQHAERYREASEILERDRRSPVSTRSLRKAFLDYRDLFDDLVGNYDEELQRVA
jgi:hypothetical protein